MSAGFTVLKWAAQQAPTVRRADGKADTVAHLVLVNLAIYADKTGRARPSLPTLADGARLTERVTRDALSRLTDRGLISAAGELNGTVVWKLNTDLRRDESELSVARARREAARHKHADRSRRYRERQANRDAEPARHATVGVTPNHDARDAEVQRHVTPRYDARDAVKSVTTAGQTPCNCHELPMNCQEHGSTPEPVVRAATPKRSSSTQDKPARQDVEQLCTELRDCRIALGDKPPTISKTWRDEARRLLDLDGRPLDQARAVLAWSQQDTFWRRNIQSIPTFREKYDRLRLEWQDKGAPAQLAPAAIEDPLGWLRAQWDAGRTGEITERTGIAYERPNLPLTVGKDDAKAWRRDHVRAWITANRDAILAALTRKAS